MSSAVVLLTVGVTGCDSGPTGVRDVESVVREPNHRCKIRESLSIDILPKTLAFDIV